MNRMQEWLARAAEELGVRIIVGFDATLSNGRHLQAQALFPDFGATFGTLVFNSADVIDPEVRHDLVAQGYTMSAFGAPLENEEFDVENYAEMFSEWGWTSNDKEKPPWLK